MEYGRGSHLENLSWDEKVLLHLYFRKSSYINELKEYVTGHPQRTYRVINRLERQGLIESHYEKMRIKTKYGDTNIGVMRIIILTDKGREYVEKVILPKLQKYGKIR